MPLHLEVITPERRVYEDDVDMVIAPGSEGYLGILPHHAPLFTTLGPGEFRAKKGGVEEAPAVFGGFMDVRGSRVVLPADAAAPVETSPPIPTPDAALYSKLRVFVASESTNQVWVLEGAKGQPYQLVGKIPVGMLPHQMGTSPDGKWIAVNNRMANTTSIIDPIAMKEVARLAVGKQPHAITWSPDAKTLFVGHERDTYIARFEAGTWKPLPPLMVGAPQHVMTIPRSHPNELWFTLTNTAEADVLRVYDLDTNKITPIKISDVHDAYFTPDESEVWSSSSG